MSTDPVSASTSATGLVPVAPLAHAARGPHGAPVAPPGVVVSIAGLGTRVLIEAYRSRVAEAAAILEAAIGVAPPAGPTTAATDEIAIFGVAPGRWHAVATKADPGLAGRLAAALAGRAAVIDISYGFAVVRLAGPKVRDMLGKLVSIDLDAAAFPPGAVAQTEMHTLSVQIRRLPGDDRFEATVSASYAESFLEAFVMAGAAYSVVVDDAA